MLEPLPSLRQPQKPRATLSRNLPARAALDWLGAGWRDLWTAPLPSLLRGLIVTFASWAVLFALYRLELLYLALPAVAGFLIVGPFLAIGLYEKSRRIEEGEPIRRGAGLVARPASAAQIAFAGLLLGILVLFWLRSADLLYAFFFGLAPFPGAKEALINVLTTPKGWALLVTGTVVGSLFAGFAFAISLFSMPMLTSLRQDTLTAMGLSFALTMQNLAPCILWGGIVAVGLAISAATGLLGLIVIFPLLGHGTWHAWRAVAPSQP